MRKTYLFVIVSLLSLSIMGCGLIGFTQSKLETPTPMPLAEQNIPQAPQVQPTSAPPPVLEEGPTPTVDPLAQAKSCLANTWEMNGLSNYVLAAVPPELAEEYNLQYEGNSGKAYFTLSPDGSIRLSAENLEFQFGAQVAVFEVPVIVHVNGTAVGRYTVNRTTLTSTDIDTRGLSASAQALGEDLIDPNQIINAIPLLNPPFNTAEYTCQGDTLELKIIGFPGEIPPLVFQAVK